MVDVPRFRLDESDKPGVLSHIDSWLMEVGAGGEDQRLTPRNRAELALWDLIVDGPFGRHSGLDDRRARIEEIENELCEFDNPSEWFSLTKKMQANGEYEWSEIPEYDQLCHELDAAENDLEDTVLSLITSENIDLILKWAKEARDTAREAREAGDYDRAERYENLADRLARASRQLAPETRSSSPRPTCSDVAPTLHRHSPININGPTLRDHHSVLFCRAHRGVSNRPWVSVAGLIPVVPKTRRR